MAGKKILPAKDCENCHDLFEALEALRKARRETIHNDVAPRSIARPGFLPLRCHARYWNPRRKRIETCSSDAKPGHYRCALHLPDGSRLDGAGVPRVKR